MWAAGVPTHHYPVGDLMATEPTPITNERPVGVVLAVDVAEEVLSILDNIAWEGAVAAPTPGLRRVNRARYALARSLNDRGAGAS